MQPGPWLSWPLGTGEQGTVLAGQVGTWPQVSVAAGWASAAV